VVGLITLEPLVVAVATVSPRSRSSGPEARAGEWTVALPTFSIALSVPILGHDEDGRRRASACSSGPGRPRRRRRGGRLLRRPGGHDPRTDGADTIRGTPELDVIEAGDGDDLIRGGAATTGSAPARARTGCSAPGAEEKVYGAPVTTCWSGWRIDTLTGEAGRDRLSGRPRLRHPDSAMPPGSARARQP